MIATDFRDETWSLVRQRLQGRMASVYSAWFVHGPATTRQLAELSGIDILNVRPRTTDLCDIGLVMVVGGEGGEGVYRVRTQSEWEHWMEDQRPSVDGQLRLL
jgi:hypothetical protein